MTRIHGLVLIGSLVLGGGTASAGPLQSGDDIPVACRMYSGIPADAHGSPLEWNNLLSLASCMQDASVTTVTDPAQLAPYVEAMADALAPEMMIYLGALEFGPGTVQLRASYHVGMAYIALITRARSSLVAPADLGTNVEAANHYRRLHADLEPMLVRAKRTAWVAFAVIEHAVAEDPTLAPDAVTRHMVATARAMLAALLRDGTPHLYDYRIAH